MGAGGRRIRDALAIACVVALCPPGAGAAAGEREAIVLPGRRHAHARAGRAAAARSTTAASVREDAR